ncbi:MAG: molybdenum cofactor biosynthesis protein MoaE [Rhodospirillales bacterium]|jgi:molybdopterin synthase catalytic subunit
MTIRVQSQDFDAGAEIAKISATNTNVGGVCSFIGVVRESADTISAMTLEHYPGMTEKLLAKIEAEAQERWPLEDSLIIHRYGRMEPGEQIVLVVTASAHRKAAFEACEFLIDWLKTKAPFWKSEETAEGTKWVEAKASDDQAADKWSEK